MRNSTENSTKNRSPIPSKLRAETMDNIPSHFAFDNFLLPNITTLEASGRVIMAKSAALKLLEYSEKDLLTKTEPRSLISKIEISS